LNNFFPFSRRKNEGEGGEGRLVDGARKSTHASAYPAKSATCDPVSQQSIAILSNIKRKLAESAAATAATAIAAAPIAGAAAAAAAAAAATSRTCRD